MEENVKQNMTTQFARKQVTFTEENPFYNVKLICIFIEE